MSDDIMNAEPGRYEVQGTPLGMNELVAAWRNRSAQAWAAAVKAQGLFAGRIPEWVQSVSPPPVFPETGALELPELLIPAAIMGTGDPIAEGQLIEAVALPWFKIIKELERDPNFLHHLDWRKVEELIAGAYKQEGWPEVILTPRSSDGGRDVIVSKPGVGAVRFFDQVKAYGPGRKVPADDVRALLGVLDLHQNVSKAVITTTALFAPGVHEEFKRVTPYRLELKDGPKLREWLLGLAPGGP